MAQVRTLSRSSQPFQDRAEAGKLLADALGGYRGQNTVVLGIPRGGVVVAREVARALGAALDIVLAHKLRTPGHAELAMGSVSEDGRLFINHEVVREMGIDDFYIQREKVTQLSEMNRRAEIIRCVRPKVSVKGKIAIVIDDGVATGATTQAALWAVKMEQPQKLVAAIPVGPEDTIRRLAKDVDEMVCLRAPPSFAAVGQFYQQFYPIEDEEMLQILREANKKAA